jgi:XTP/dITP diphosphohydrolase
MEKLVFATNNLHKLTEVRSMLEPEFEIISLADLNCFDDIAETAETLDGNALLKANYIYSKFGINCFADDTGLEVESLHGAPGVYSARYAGEDNNAHNNMNKVLSLLGDNKNRKACFRTVISLIRHNKIIYFEGKIEGKIALKPQGENGFGYDPIFIPDEYNVSFAELDAVEKNKISHRALAVEKLVNYLKLNL